jgi:phosphoglycerol transferase MdoB-like AlkP superfamily enzyme
MSFYRSVRRGAAYEIGRRLWGWFLALEIIRFVVRRVLPIAIILTALGISVWFGIRSAGWWLPRLTSLAAIAILLGAATWLYRRYRWEIRSGLPRTAVAAMVLGLAGAVGAAVYWLR